MESINMFCALQRVLLPTILGVCMLYRPVGISLIYLIMFLILPFVPLASAPRLRAPVMAYFIIFIILSSLILLCHFGLGILGYVTGDKSSLGGCSYQEVLFRHIGFNHLDDLSALDTVECIWPDVLVFLGVVIIFAVLKKFAGRVSLESVESRIDDQERLGGNEDSNLIEFKILKKTGPTVCLVSLFLAAVLRPSVPGGFYFLVVLLSATHWACYKRFASGFGIILRCVMIVLVFHIVAVISYQTPWAQEKLHNSTLPARLLALESVVISVCFDENEATDSLVTFNAHLHSDSYLSPIIILASYYILALTSSYLINKKNLQKRLGGFSQLQNTTKLKRQVSILRQPTRNIKRDSRKRSFNVTSRHERRSEPNEKTPLTMGRKSVLNFDENPETETVSIELQHFGITEEGTSATLLDHIWYGVQSTSKFVYGNSYIFTNILMMVWSIVYHSWLTFFLLIWAYILWMIPNQRKAMLRSSPFVVFYAQLLLIAQYIYGMRLNDDELPTRLEIKGINLKQIGFGREEELPCIPLIIKALFTLMFWFTLRQRCKEAEEKKKKSTLADMVAPLQLTMGAAASDLAPKQEDKKTSKFFEQFGTFIRILLIKSWMWLLLVIVFLSGITGTKMTGFRICYMALFLFFILAFQCSWRMWLKVMYGFWVFLIIYVMSILIMIYTYQFDRFDEYWYNYLNISMELQKDIGLQQYETKDLFLHLVTPTLLVIMTIIQIHYFHKRFVEHLKIDIPVSDSSVFNEQRHSEEVHHSNEQEQGLTTADLQEKGKLKQFKKLLINLLKRFYQIFRDFAKNSLEFFWMLLELHMIKVIFLTAFINCVVKVSVLHISFVFLCVIAVITKTSAQIYISRLISVLVSILVLANMIYQVDYIDHTQHNVKCNNGTSPTLNNAEWFGLQKISVSETLLYVLRGYIVYIVVTTLHAVAVFRQEQRRAKRGLPLTRPHLMFKNTTVEDAYKNVVGLIKYLFNYGFYRLGFEISLITLVATIAYRQDLLAIIYALWLCIFFCLERERSDRIWIVFQWFIAIVIPVQYILFVGLPPSLCIGYPWETHAPVGFYPWALLPGPKLLHESRKVIFDFILLLIITRQRRAYSIERKYEKSNAAYPGGKNKPESIDTEKLGMESFQNPVHDFRTTVRNWLDVLFTIVFVGFFWTTLAVVFLASTSVVSVFSLGYLVGAFIFLWQGTDFYLHPLRKILLYWRIFLGYNVIIIALKTILQIGVCFFFVDLIQHTCWLVHILGVSCIGNIGGVEDSERCPPLSENSGISWDATCFAFLIFQLRIFGSQYFQHVINDAKATGILASRGAMLIEDFRQKQIQHRTNHERDVLRKIKAKMERIRATQKGISRPVKKPTHYDEDVTVPVHRSSSISSCPGSGYHTPIEDEPGDRKDIEAQSDLAETLFMTHFTGSSLQNQVTSPSSAILTISLDDYLEPKTLSFGSPTNSDAHIQHYDDAYPVFSNDENSFCPSSGRVQLSSVGTQTSTSVLQARQHRRQSSVNTVSWNEPVEFEDSNKGKFLKTSNDIEGQTSILRKRTHLNSGSVCYYQENIMTDNQKRRHSNLSWANDESMSIKTTSLRPNSWGPIGNMCYIDSVMSEISRTSTHGESIRVGDYFMFTDPDEKIELSLMDEGGDFLEDEGKISASEKKISKRKGLFEVYQDIEKRKRSKKSTVTVSAPTSKIGTSDDKEKEQRSTVSDPLPKSSPPDLEKDKTPRSPDTPDKPSSSSSPPKEAEEEKEIGLLPRIFEGLMVSFAIRLNRLSRNYRYVMTILSDEKKILKEALTFGHGGRPELVSTWKTFKDKSGEAQHTNSDTKLNKDNLENQSLSRSDDIDTDTKSITVEIDVDTKDNTNRMQPDASMALVKSTEEFDEVEFTTREHNIVVEVLISMWYVILSNTAILCYLCVFINQIHSASMLSLPLPLMVFIWGTLAIPRPSKFFWITLIAYTQCIVIVKCIFQFKTFMFKNINLPNQPLAADKIIGIQPADNYAVVDLLLLLVVFFHRFILKSQGLWDAYDVEPNVQSGTYILKDELPEDDDTGSLHEARQTAIVTSGNDTLVITKKKLGDDEEVDELNLQVSNNLEEPGNYVPEVVKISSTKYFSPAVDFFKSLLYKTRLPTDVYALMFLCDFINFLVLLFGFTAFGTQSGDESGVQDIFTENKVPIPFLIMLLIQFLLIIIDRALYLRKALIMKIVFHFISVIGIHIWMFFILPAITERNFNSLLSPVIFYIIKCFYFLLSSYQITCGYPKRILGNFLTRGYTIFNMHAFRVYKMVPFLFELRTFLDWVCTDTTMTMWEWLKMEDIFSEIFFLKCNRDYEKAFPVPRGNKKDMLAKLLLGGTFILLSVIFIWAPLTLFAVFTAVGQSNIPTRVVTSIKIGSFHPIYEMSTEDQIYGFEDKEMSHLQGVYLKNKTAMTFITSYYPSDIAAIVLPSHSATVWGISPPDKEELIEDLAQNRTIPIRLTYSISRRSPKDENEEVINLVTTYELGQNFEGRQKLIGILQGKSSTQDFIAVPDILPKFIEVKNTGKVIPIRNMLPNNKGHTTLLLKLSRNGDEGNNILWWEIKENCNDSLIKRIVTELPHTECGMQIAIYTFNDKKFPPTFTWVSASGIIGMYTGFVLVASRLLRGILFDSTSRIMFLELPYVDRVLQLCLDVYLVREAKEFELEEDLYGKLLFLYRSPETMIKWTRPKKSIEEDGQDTESRSTTRRMPE